MNLCDRCGNYPNICGCEDVDILSAKLSRHEHWIADLTREAEALLSFIDGQTQTPEEDQIYSQAEEGELRSMPGPSGVDHFALSLLHSLRNATGLGEVATESPEPPAGEASLPWY